MKNGKINIALRNVTIAALCRVLCSVIGVVAFWCISLLGSIQSAVAQEVHPERAAWREVVTEEYKREEMRILFVVAKNKIEPNYMNNVETLDSIANWVNRVQQDSTINLVGVEFCGAVSPEGSVRFNHWLSKARLSALENYMRKRIDISEDIIVRNDRYIAWNELDSMVSASDMHNKEQILQIVRSENRSTGEQLDSRIGELKAMDNGKTWRLLLNTHFRKMRNAYAVLVTKKTNTEYQRTYEPITPSRPVSFPMEIHCPDMASMFPTVTPVRQTNMYVKTNVVGLAMLAANVGVEFDMGRYLSLNIPISYSAINYFKPTIKFRHFSLQPELRVWPMKNYDRLFIGAHVGFAYYNYAFDGDWRYQDHDGNCPTLGGGLSLGYRLPISKDNRWKLEFAVGAGVYPLYYDIFHNTKDVKKGELYKTDKKTYIGLDNVMVGISYRIPLKRKSKPVTTE